MKTNPNIWINTLPGNNNDFNNEKYKLDPNKWVGSLPKENSGWVGSVPKANSGKAFTKYSVVIILFVIGLISVSAIKNETRGLQKNINFYNSLQFCFIHFSL